MPGQLHEGHGDSHTDTASMGTNEAADGSLRTVEGVPVSRARGQERESGEFGVDVVPAGLQVPTDCSLVQAQGGGGTWER